MPGKYLLGLKIACLLVFTAAIGCNLDMNGKTQRDKFTVVADSGDKQKVNPSTPTDKTASPASTPEPMHQDQPPMPEKPKIDPEKPVLPQAGKVVKMNKNVFLQTLPDGQRRVLVNSYVCLRKGQLEVLLCRTLTKEHESILASDIDARFIHAGLLATKAEAGSPVQYVPKYKPAHGTKIKVSVQYKDKDGKTVTKRAQEWVRNFKTRKELKYDWVFAGSKFIDVGPKEPPIYAANDGTVICVANFDVAMLDLPVELSNVDEDLLYEAWTERIPPEGTPVLVILEPILAKEK